MGKPIIAAMLGAAVVSAGAAEGAPPRGRVGRTVAHVLDSGLVANAGRAGGERVVFAGVVLEPRALWVRVRFSRVELAPGAYLRLTSVRDGAVQYLDGSTTDRRGWSRTSAYFNGDAVKVELVAPGGASARPSRVAIDSVIAGVRPGAGNKGNGGGGGGGGIAEICGPTDDRLPTTDPRAARLGNECTAFLIDVYGGMLTAGHCQHRHEMVVEFNVPPSDEEGNPVAPPPKDQYEIDEESIQTAYTGLGDDWSYFGCLPNSSTGLTPFEAQGAYYALADAPPQPAGQGVRLSGFGSVGPPLPPQWNLTLLTHAGPLVEGEFGPSVVCYEVDTTGGDSGAAVVDAGDGRAIAIHTTGGCTGLPGSSNMGTPIDNAGLRRALANPMGVLAPTLENCYANCDGDAALDVGDFACFAGLFAAGDPRANCDGSVDAEGKITLDIEDFVCFQMMFARGCE